MTTTTPNNGSKIINTATLQFSSDPNDPRFPGSYPFISGLRSKGFNAVLRNGQIGLTPPDKVTQKMLQIARQNAAAIIREIESLYAACSEDRASDSMICLQSQKWADEAHDLDVVEKLISHMFLYCHHLGWASSAYWDGDPLPKPANRPYCYIRCETINGIYHYFPIIADADGTDYLWVDAQDWISRNCKDRTNNSVTSNNTSNSVNREV